MTKRKEPFSSIYELKIGAELVIEPNDGESSSNALKRLKKRTIKYQTDGRFYRLKLNDNTVVIQRIAKEHRGPLADYRMMKAGTAILVKSSPTTAHQKRASQLCDALSSVQYNSWKSGRPLTREDGYWEPMKDGKGRLLIARYRGDSVEDYVPAANGSKYGSGEVPVLQQWEGEWS